jgi:putative toxin-antitoxin system antitoxin component (TIGR02293 family)
MASTSRISGKDAPALKKRPPATRARSVTTVSPGARAVLTLSAAGVMSVVRHLKGGLPYRVVTQFQKASQLPLATIARVTQISPRTMARRKQAGRLTRGEAERLFRLSQIYRQAVRLFDGDAAGARRWLQSPNAALGDESPLSLAESEFGAREVENVIGRLEHGVFA